MSTPEHRVDIGAIKTGEQTLADTLSSRYWITPAGLAALEETQR